MEQTSRLGDAAGKVADGFDLAREAIVEMDSAMVSTLDELQQRSRLPHRVEVEFGLKFSAQGKGIVASASGEASLRVLLSYDAQRPAS